jgi:hypothetical protein
MKRIILVSFFLAALTACSKDKPAVYISNHLWGSGEPSLVTVTLQMKKFDSALPANLNGAGVLSVERSEGAVPGWTGIQPVEWKVVTPGQMLLITVPGAKDGFFLEVSPMNNAGPLPSTGTVRQFWCQTCEEGRQGDLGWLPGQFNLVKDDNS